MCYLQVFISPLLSGSVRSPSIAAVDLALQSLETAAKTSCCCLSLSCFSSKTQAGLLFSTLAATTAPFPSAVGSVVKTQTLCVGQILVLSSVVAFVQHFLHIESLQDFDPFLVENSEQRTYFRLKTKPFLPREESGTRA